MVPIWKRALLMLKGTQKTKHFMSALFKVEGHSRCEFHNLQFSYTIITGTGVTRHNYFTVVIDMESTGLLT